MHLACIVNGQHIKPNRYKLYLLDILGVTFIGLTLTTTFVLLVREWENKFIWILEILGGLFFRSNVFPQVFVSYKDLALINAINIGFLKLPTFFVGSTLMRMLK